MSNLMFPATSHFAADNVSPAISARIAVIFIGHAVERELLKLRVPYRKMQNMTVLPWL